MSDIVERFGLREVINVSGTMTALGASAAPPEVVEAVAGILPRFVDMSQLQQKAGAVIARVIGAEAGCVTACAASGIAVGVAACLTGLDVAKAEQLPDTRDLKDEVVIQKGHLVWFGASVGQLIRLSGARPVEVGDATRAGAYQLAGALGERTAAAVYVTSHHTVQYGLIDLRTFCQVCHQHGVPVVVDAASESDMHAFLAEGADLVCFSAHKFLAGATAGIIAGQRDLVKACYIHQNAGIGRTMKAGKESIVGVMAALERWEKLDHAAEKARNDGIARLFLAELTGLPGLTLSSAPDPTGNPIDRVAIRVDETSAGLSAFHLARELAGGVPPIIVRDHHAIDEQLIYLDPCNVTPEQAKLVTACLRQLLQLPAAAKAAVRARYPERPNGADRQAAALLNW